MLSEINTEPQISQSTDPELSKSSSEIQRENNKIWKSTNFKEKVESVWLCTMSTRVLRILLTAALNLPFKDNIPFI
jgi:hypothetical protein